MPRPLAVSGGLPRSLLAAVLLIGGLPARAGGGLDPTDLPANNPNASPAILEPDPTQLPMLRWEPTFTPNPAHALAPPLRARHTLPLGYPLASFELLQALFVSGILYHFDTATNAPDWEYRFTWESQRDKLLLGQGLRFDDNAMVLNSPGHPTSGALFYLASRASGLSVSQSVLMTFSAALAWEVWWEYREVVGLNDLLMTTICGLAFGEVVWQLSELFAHGADNTGNRVAAALLAGYASFDPWRPPRVVGPRGPLDRHGLPVDVWHRIQIEAGVETSQPAPFRAALGPMLRIGYGLINVPGFGSPGRRSRLLEAPSYSRFNLHFGLDERGLSEFELRAQADYFGWYHQDLRDREGGGVVGVAGALGLSAYFEHRTFLLPRINAQRASASVAGATLHLSGFLGPWLAQLDAAFYPSFSMVSSVGLTEWSTEHSVTTLSSVLRNQGYYFGISWVGIIRAAVELGPAEIAVTWKRYDVTRLTGLDRDYSAVPDARRAIDDGDELSATVLVPTGLSDLRLKLSGRRVLLWGKLEDIQAAADDWQAALGLVLAY